jgi:WD40 repeat protein
VGPVKLDQHGDPLPPGAISRYGSIRLRHGPQPRGLGFSPDGKMLGSIAATEDGIRLWDPLTGKELYRLHSPATHAAFARDGSMLVVDENRCHVWIPAANSFRSLPEKTLSESVQVVAMHPDCRSFVVGMNQKIMQIDILTGKVIRELKCPAGPIPVRLIFSPDGRWLAGCGQKTGVWLWDLRTGKRVRTYPIETDFPESVFNSDGTRLAIAAEQLRIFSTDSEEMIEDYKAPEGALLNPRFSADGKWVYGITAEGNFIQIHAQTGAKKEFGMMLEVGLRPPMAVAPEGSLVAATDQDGAIRVWDPRSSKELELERLPGLFRPAFSTDGKSVSCLSADGRIHTFATETGKRTKVIDLPVDEDSPVAWSALSQRAIAVNCGDGIELEVIDVPANRTLHKILVPTNGLVPRIAFCAADRERVAAFGDGIVAVVNISTGKIVRTMEVGPCENQQPAEGAISADGRLVAVSTHPSSVWEVASGKKRYDLDAIGHFSGAVFSPDGRYLAAWEQRLGHLVVFDVRHGTPVSRFHLQILENETVAVVFSKDGKRLAAGSMEGGITVWDTLSGDVLNSLDRHDGAVSGLAFSPDGSKLASSALDGTVLIWELAGQTPGKLADLEVSGLQEAYRLLGSESADQAQRGIEFLYRRPGETVKLFAERIVVPTATPTDKLTRLIADLGSEDFPVRQAAVKELEMIGGEATPALRAIAEKSTDPEARKLADEVLTRTEAPSLKADDLRLVRMIELLENLATADARALLAKWAAGPPGHRLTREATAALEHLKAR